MEHSIWSVLRALRAGMKAGLLALAACVLMAGCGCFKVVAPPSQRLSPEQIRSIPVRVDSVAIDEFQIISRREDPLTEPYESRTELKADAREGWAANIKGLLGDAMRDSGEWRPVDSGVPVSLRLRLTKGCYVSPSIHLLLMAFSIGLLPGQETTRVNAKLRIEGFDREGNKLFGSAELSSRDFRKEEFFSYLPTGWIPLLVGGCSIEMFFVNSIGSPGVLDRERKWFGEELTHMILRYLAGGEVQAAVAAVRERERRTEEAKVALREFSKKAAEWRSLPVKPAMPEEARKFAVQAEDAFRSKDFERAISLYEKALGFNELWPEGQFNVALICGELGQYGKAIFHMKRYLELEPDAKEARAARDKMYVWEGKTDVKK